MFESHRKSQKSKSLIITSSHEVPLSRDELWKAITDPQILQACLKSCEEVQQPQAGEYAALFNIRLGPVKKHFVAQLNIIDSIAKDNYRLKVLVNTDFKAKAEATADVMLESLPGNNTRINYEATAVLYGWLAKFQSKLLEHFAKKQIGLFFDQVAEQAQNTTGR